jgi:hypothetical protein
LSTPRDELEEVVRSTAGRESLGILLGDWLNAHLLESGSFARSRTPEERCDAYGVTAFLMGNNVMGPQGGRAFRGAPVTAAQIHHSGAIEGLHRAIPFGFKAFNADDIPGIRAAFSKIQNLLGVPGGNRPLDRADNNPLAMFVAIEDALSDEFTKAEKAARGLGEKVRITASAHTIAYGLDVPGGLPEQ